MLKWLCKQPKKKPMSYWIPDKLLKEKSDELNKRDKAINLDSDWQPVEGMYWYDEIVQQSPTDQAKLQPSGIPLKLFINTKTGEYKSFHTNVFKTDTYGR
jgi:hypothetical protein